jgi:hypothetical protein
VNNELERIWKEAVVANFRYYPGVRLDGLRKPRKYFSQDKRSPVRDLNPGPPEYEVVVLTTRRSVTVLHKG